ncbi:c-type cytochrome [Arenibaculum pallidiluteum]|uniref:c-type cytochrome n=1 Tax=Arenibaculum pallidiluteum TaxID=2812559 RepID=UPI001A95B874|nr:c-type cytochrome [Arenibaculum pallidiluteum]
MRSIAVGALALLLSGPAGAAEDPVKRGEYLSRIMDCTGCHTPGGLTGKPEADRYLSGSELGLAIPDLGVFYPPNLTPDDETGLGTWSEADIVRALRTGTRPNGRILAPVMPWVSYASLTDGDAAAIAAYLKSLPAVSHRVPPPLGPKEQPRTPYLGVVVP